MKDVFIFAASMDKQDEILISCSTQFKRYGIKTLTMDDLARNQGISKKTLYKYYKDKNDLVVKSVEYNILLDRNLMLNCCNQNMNAIEENYFVSNMILQQLTETNASFWYDLERYHPKAMAVMNNHMRVDVFKYLCDNLKRGIEEGHYRSNIKIPIIADTYLSKLGVMFEPEYYSASDYSFSDVYQEIFRYHIRGIASDKGIIVLKEKLNRENLKSDDF